MERREFLKLARAAGVVIPTWSLLPPASAQSGMYTGKILINIHADGGIDQSSWVDPREKDGTLNTYAKNGVAANVSGNIRSAPMGNNKAFFDAHFRQILVINGLHSETNGHDEGTRNNATGRLDMGYPNISELFASVNGKGMPMPWLNSGGFRTSAGLVPPTAVPSANALRSITQPNAVSATNDFMKQADIDRVQAARADRMKAMQVRTDLLPRQRMVVEEFIASSESRAKLQAVAAMVPATFDQQAQAQIALIAGAAGITSTVQLASGGFDAHSNIDNDYANALPRLTNLIDYIWQKASDLGIANRVFLRVYSEFGRTPLNAGNGKDHWEVGTQIWMEANPAWGNRVFGASGPKHEPLKINPTTGAIDAAAGFVIKPRHVHAALRKYLNIQTTDPRFDLKVPANEMFDFFNSANSTGYPTM